MGRFIAVIALLVVVQPQRADAFAWASSLGRLLQRATVIEVVEVAAIGPRPFDPSWDVRVTEAIRGADEGALTSIHSIWGLPRASVGQRFLVVCDPELCPRAIGVESGGAFVLKAYQPMDTAIVSPPIVEHRAVADLAAGRAVPDLCVNIDVALVDEPAVTMPVSVTVSAADASCSDATTSLGLMPARIGSPLHPDDPDARLTVLLGVGDGHHRTAVLDVGILNRGADGCLRGPALAEFPLVRTAAEFASAFRDAPADVTIADGTVDVSRGNFVRHGSHRASIVLTASRGLELRGLGSRALPAIDEGRSTYREVTFRLPGPHRPSLSIRLPPLARWDTVGRAALLSALVAIGPQQWTVAARRDPDRTDVVIGVASMRHHSEPIRSSRTPSSHTPRRHLL